MLSEVPTPKNAMSAEGRSPSAPEPPLAESPDSVPQPRAAETQDASQTSREAPPISAPPASPGDRLVARIQQMSHGRRWALGLALAFLSGVAAASVLGLPLYMTVPAALSVALIVASVVLALAAGFVLSTWKATWVLVAATAIGAGLIICLAIILSPNPAWEGATGIAAVITAFIWFAILGLVPLTAILFIGNAIGWWREVGTV